MPRATQKVVYDRMLADLCRESYYAFFLEFWPLIAAEKLINNWHIEYLCNELQIISERVFLNKPREYDLVGNCPPGSSKSSIFSILWQPWVWTRMPSARFITGSYAENLALDLSRKSRDVVTSEKYTKFFPEIKLREDQNAKGYFANTAGGFRKAIGVGGVIIGMHAHFLGIDDPIDPQGALSDKNINESNVWMNEGLSQRKVDRQVSVTALVMQRLHQNDSTGNWLDREAERLRSNASLQTNLKHICIPATTEWPIFPPELAQRYDEDGLFEPVRYPRKVLDEEQNRLGEVGYAGQYGQQPVPRGGAMFQVDRLRCEPTIPVKWKRGPVRYWDKAATAGGGSWTAGVKMAMDFNDNCWILDVIRGRWESGQRERIIIDTAKIDGKNCRIGIEQEPGGAGKESAESASRAYRKEGFRVFVDLVRASKEERALGAQEEQRSDSFSVQVNTHKVIMVPAVWNYTFKEELRFFPNSRYKDQVDAAVGAYSMLSKKRLRFGAL